MNLAHSTLSQLLPFVTPMPNPLEGDWLTENDESSETLDEFSRKEKARFQPGEFRILISMYDATSSEMTDLACGIVPSFYPGAITVMETTLNFVDDAQLHRRPSIGFGEQILAEGLMAQVKSREGSFAHLAITGADIYYDARDRDDWGYGYSNWEDGSAIVATPRCGDIFGFIGRRRLIKLVLHEIGHLFYLPHCVLFRCLMNGINNDAELDAIPMELCPECIAKYVLLSGCCPKQRFIGLSKYWNKHNMKAEAARAYALSKRLSV